MVNKDFFQALDDLEAEKKINKEVFIKALEAALSSAYKKMYGEAKSAVVKLNPEKCTIKIYSYKTVVEEVSDRDKEISLADAKLIKKTSKIGDTLMEEESTKDFGRIAAQTAQQVVMQKLKDIERQMAVDEISERESELVTTIIKRIDNDTVYVKIGDSHTEGIMLPSDQIPKEKYEVGQRLKVFVKKIKTGFNGPQIQVSRSNNSFLRKLFELEVPEVQNGIIEIKSISRVAGSHAKVALHSTRPEIDPVGSCVGMHSSRINQIVNEINGEKIDLIVYSDDPLEYIARALSPATVISVETNESLKASRVIVSDDQLSLAIGRGGQNVKLASKLTGWKIDIRSESAMNKVEEIKAIDDSDFELTELDETDTIPDVDDIEPID